LYLIVLSFCFTETLRPPQVLDNFALSDWCFKLSNSFCFLYSGLFSRTLLTAISVASWSVFQLSISLVISELTIFLSTQDNINQPHIICVATFDEVEDIAVFLRLSISSNESQALEASSVN
jgi:hypothetical protein